MSISFQRLSIVLGSPGAGKDTQLSRLTEKFGCNILYIGDAVRALAKSNKEVMLTLESGGLVDNDLVNDIFMLKLQQYESTDWVVSDGFPRTVEQAVWLDKLVGAQFNNVTDVILLRIDDTEARKRLESRDRHDDLNTIVEQRIKQFHIQTMPVAEYYKALGRLNEVDGMGTEQQVFERLETALEVKAL